MSFQAQLSFFSAPGIATNLRIGFVVFLFCVLFPAPSFAFDLYRAPEAAADSAISLEQQPSVGNVAQIYGSATVRHGEFILSPQPAISFADDQYYRQLGPNDSLHEGDIIETLSSSSLKIYFNDDSILDVGPNSVLKIEVFAQNGQERTVLVRLLRGEIRTLVTRPLVGNSTYVVATMNSKLSVQDNESTIRATLDGTEYKTDVSCSEGKIAIHVPGTADPIALNSGQKFSCTGMAGSNIRYLVSKMDDPNAYPSQQ